MATDIGQHQPHARALPGFGASAGAADPACGGGQPSKSASAPVIAVLAYDTQYSEYIPRLLPFKPELKEVLEADAVRHQEHARFNSALQAGCFLLSVRAAGLAAGPLAGFDSDGVDDEFFPDGRLKSFLLVNIGKPGDNPWFERLPRLEYEEAVSHLSGLPGRAAATEQIRPPAPPAAAAPFAPLSAPAQGQELRRESGMLQINYEVLRKSQEVSSCRRGPAQGRFVTS